MFVLRQSTRKPTVFRDDKAGFAPTGRRFIGLADRRSHENRYRHEDRPALHKAMATTHVEVGINRDMLQNLAATFQSFPNIGTTVDKRNSTVPFWRGSIDASVSGEELSE